VLESIPCCCAGAKLITCRWRYYFVKKASNMYASMNSENAS